MKYHKIINGSYINSSMAKKQNLKKRKFKTDYNWKPQTKVKAVLNYICTLDFTALSN